MKKIFFLLSILFFCKILISDNIDSLNNLVNSVADSSKANIYMELIKASPLDSVEMMISYAEKAEFYADKSLSDSAFADFLNNIGMRFYSIGNYTYAQKYFEKSADVENSINNTENVAKMHTNIAVTLELRGKYTEAIEYYMKALVVFEKMQKTDNVSMVYSNLAVLYLEMGNREKAVEYNFKSLEIEKKSNNKSGMASTYINLGLVYESLKNLDSALLYYEKAKNIYLELNDTQNYAILSQNIGGIYYYQKDYKLAFDYLNDAEEIMVSLNYVHGLAWVYQGKAKILLATKKYEKAIDFLNKSSDLVLQMDDMKTECENYKIYADIYNNKGDYKKAAEYLYKYNELGDSLNSYEVQRNINELNKKFETTLLEYKLDILDKENKLSEEKLRKNQMLTFALVVLVVLLITTLILMRKALKNKSLYQKLELKQNVLRLQMNPHFISNALGSVQNFILENKIDEASDYLANFASLMRDTIKATKNNLITLHEELEITKKYLTIQKYKRNDLFDFEIKIQDNLETDFYGFPPMILQPIVENSIKHGFKNINYKGKIEIKITANNENVRAEIIDNGVGYWKNNKSKDSYSVNITKDRLKLLSKKYKGNATVTIENVEETNQTGTRVVFVIPNITV